MNKIESMLRHVGMKNIEITQYHISGNDNIIKYFITSPHEGNHFKWVLRISTCAAFDRWANSIPIEEFFNTEENLVDYICNNQLKIYKELLCYLSEEYWDLYEVYQGDK